jgi:MFS family permease
MSLVAMAFLWTGSQIPVYLFGESQSFKLARSVTNLTPGGIPPYIYGELGGTDRWVWFVLANLLALAAVCPFVGAMSDLWGRRYVALTGASFIVLGMIVCSTAHKMNTFIGRFLPAGPLFELFLYVWSTSKQALLAQTLRTIRGCFFSTPLHTIA